MPSTAGSGAEVTPNATIWDRRHGRKLSLRGAAVRPASVILDPDLLLDLPGLYLVSGALDSLCQGAEAAWSIRSTPESVSRGLAAVALAADALARLPRVQADALQAPALADRLIFQIAGHLSGLAIAKTPTSSCHAISYPLTLCHRVPHGLACGMNIGRLLRYNATVDDATIADRRGVEYVRVIMTRIAGAMRMASPESAADWLDSMFSAFGLEDLTAIKVSPAKVAADALSYDRCHDNPRRVDLESLTVLLGPVRTV